MDTCVIGNMPSVIARGTKTVSHSEKQRRSGKLNAIELNAKRWPKAQRFKGSEENTVGHSERFRLVGRAKESHGVCDCRFNKPALKI